VRLAPQFVESWGELAWIYTDLGRDEESVAVLRQFLQEHPDNEEDHAALAWRYHYLGQSEEEIAQARRAYSFDPQNWSVCWTMLAAHTTRSPFLTEEEACHCAAEVAARFPHDAFLVQQIAALYAAWGREAPALEYARQAVALSPESVEAQARLAQVYRLFGHWKEAAEAYRNLVEKPGGRTGGWLREWAIVLKALNDPRAEDVLAEAGPANTPEDHLQCGLVYEAWGRRDEAIAAFRHCLSHSSLTTSLRRAAEGSLRRLGAANAGV
jgi:tetratricopeptide (TPR) repeat protein